MEADGSVFLNAKDNSYIIAIGGALSIGVAIGRAGGGALTLGASVGVNHIANTTSSYISGSTLTIGEDLSLNECFHRRYYFRVHCRCIRWSGGS